MSDEPQTDIPTQQALAGLAAADADMARAIAAVGPLPARSRPPGLTTLMRVVVDQQLSVASANAIWGRLEARVNPFGAEAFLALDAADAKAVGLSGPKWRYCRNLAQGVADGTLDLAAIDVMPDADSIAALTTIKGIGRWTAEIYLLFALGRPDIWPAHDLALQVSVQHLKGLEARPDWKHMDRVAESWRPWRGTAARVLWRYYHIATGRLDPA
jgi:DNA-3-methyladenine glycosylase II